MFGDFWMRLIALFLLFQGVFVGFSVGADRGLPSQADRELSSLQDSDEAILQVLAQFQQSTVLEINEAVHFLEQLLHQAEKTGAPNAVLEVAKELSRALYHKDQHEEAMQLINRIEREYGAELSQNQRIYLQLKKANLELDMSQTEVAKQRIERLSIAGSSLSNRLELRHIKARISAYEGDQTQALQMSRGVLEDAVAAGDSLIILREIFFIGALLFQMGEMEMAIDEYDRVREHFYPPYQNMYTITYNLNTGAALSQMGRFEEAEERFAGVISTAEAMKDTTMIMRALVNKAIIHSRSQQFDKALSDYELVLELSEQQANETGRMFSLMNMGTLFLDMQEYAKSEEHLLEALEIVLEKGLVNEYNYIVQTLSRVYKAVGNNERTIEFLERQTEQQASLLQKRQDQVVDDLKNQYELELKEKELANVQLAALNQRRTMMSAILILFLVSAGGIFFFFKRNQSLRVLYERNVELLNQFYVPSEEEGNPVEEDANDPLKNIFVRIKKAMEEDKLFRQHDLSISTLAYHISSNEKYTSNAISTYTKMNFNRFLNFHRINEAKRLLLQYGKEAVVSDVLEECGYASRSTFYKAFGEFTGMTPKEFITLSRRNEES